MQQSREGGRRTRRRREKEGGRGREERRRQRRRPCEGADIPSPPHLLDLAHVLVRQLQWGRVRVPHPHGVVIAGRDCKAAEVGEHHGADGLRVPLQQALHSTCREEGERGGGGEPY